MSSGEKKRTVEAKDDKNKNWIKNISKEANLGKLSENIPSPIKLLAGMEAENDIIGGILHAMWPSIREMIEEETLKEVEKSVNMALKYVPAVSDFKFKKSKMGEKYPRMRNFKLLETSNNSVILQMEVDYDGDAQVEMEVKTALGTIPLGIKDIKLQVTSVH